MAAPFVHEPLSHPPTGFELVIPDFDQVAPVRFQLRRELSDDEFIGLCAQYENCFIEVSASGEVSVTPPSYSNTGRIHAELISRLVEWAEDDGSGDVFTSSGGFVLPNGARRAPDASWIARSRIEALPDWQRASFYRLCPDFVIEVRSRHYRLAELKRKMEEYIANGAELGWLIDPLERTVWVYRPGQEPELLTGVERIAGQGPVAGFELDLRPLFA